MIWAGTFMMEYTREQKCLDLQMPHMAWMVPTLAPSPTGRSVYGCGTYEHHRRSVQQYYGCTLAL